MQSALTDATVSVHRILEPLTSDDRRKVIQAVLVLLGEAAPKATEPSNRDESAEAPSELPTQAKTWMHKSKVSTDQINTCIHIDGGNATVISLPVVADSAREKTQVSYLMTGLASLFSSGDASFTDEAARELCVHFGCYDQRNHSTYIKGLGNSVAGSKSAGWKLTVPGLTAIANKIKEQQSGD